MAEKKELIETFLQEDKYYDKSVVFTLDTVEEAVVEDKYIDQDGDMILYSPESVPKYSRNEVTEEIGYDIVLERWKGNEDNYDITVENIEKYKDSLKEEEEDLEDFTVFRNDYINKCLIKAEDIVVEKIEEEEE